MSKEQAVTDPIRVVVWSTGGVGSVAVDGIRHRPDRVDIEGDPDIHCAMTVGAAQGHGAGHAAMAATAMRVVNAVPYVVAAPAGLLSSLDIPTTLPRHVFQ
jgi:hypothetical protein